MAPIIVAYWPTRALCQPIRMLLGYRKVEFVDKFYEVGEEPWFDKTGWKEEKDKLGLDFPNLPYIIDGDIKLSQSNAIMRYLARKYDLDGKTEQEKIRIDLLGDVLTELRDAYYAVAYFSYGRTQHFESNVKKFKSDVQRPLGLIDQFLGDENAFFASNRLTYIDFLAYEALEQHRLLQSDILDNHTNLQKFMKNFEQKPEIKEFMESEKCFKGPVCNKYACFNTNKIDKIV